MEENNFLKSLPNLDEFPCIMKSLLNVKRGRCVEDALNKSILEKISLKNLPLNEFPVGTIIKFKVSEKESFFVENFYQGIVGKTRQGKTFMHLGSQNSFGIEGYSLFKQNKEFN